MDGPIHVDRRRRAHTREPFLVRSKSLNRQTFFVRVHVLIAQKIVRCEPHHNEHIHMYILISLQVNTLSIGQKTSL